MRNGSLQVTSCEERNCVGTSFLMNTSCEEKKRVGTIFLMNTSCEEKKRVGTSFLMNTSCEEKKRVGTSFLINTSCEGKILWGMILCRILHVKEKYYRLQLSAGKEYLKDTGQIFKPILLFENFKIFKIF